MKKQSTKKASSPSTSQDVIVPNPEWFDLIKSVQTEFLKRGFNTDQAYQLTYLVVARALQT